MRIGERIYKDINDFFIENNDEILTILCKANDIKKYKPTEVLGVITNSLLKANFNDEDFDKSEALVDLILNNKKISNSINEMESSFVAGLSLVSLGVALINFDQFSKTSIKKAIKENDFNLDDMEYLITSNVSEIPEEAFEYLDEYLHKNEKKKMDDDLKTELINNLIVGNIKCKVFNEKASADDIFKYLNSVNFDKAELDKIMGIYASNDKIIEELINLLVDSFIYI